MAASTSDKAKLRRMVAEPTEAVYSNATIAEYIEKYPLRDADGNTPDSADWTATYDLNAAAADIWDEKAAGLFDKYNFSADGGRFDRYQQYEAAQEKAQWHRKRAAIGSFESIKDPDESQNTTEYDSEFDYEDLE